MADSSPSGILIPGNGVGVMIKAGKEPLPRPSPTGRGEPQAIACSLIGPCRGYGSPLPVGEGRGRGSLPALIMTPTQPTPEGRRTPRGKQHGVEAYEEKNRWKRSCKNSGPACWKS